MATHRYSLRTFAAITLTTLAGAATAAPPPPKVEDLAATRPTQPGVVISTPTPAELGRCRVVPYPNKEQPVGYILYDGSNRMVRRFLAVGTKSYNILSFFKDGQEVYRETDTQGTGKLDQFRWLNANGSKVGLDTDGNGTIDTWTAISPEEVSKEVFEALVRKDVGRVQSLVLNEQDVKTLGLPAGLAKELLARSAKAVDRLQATAAELKLTDKAKWVHIELWTPETVPSDEFRGAFDLVRHRNAGVLVDKGIEGPDAATTFQLGELIQIGRVWKLVDGPATGMPSANANEGIDLPKDVQAIIKKLSELPNPGFGTPTYGAYQLQRCGLLVEVVTKLDKHPQQELFIRQLLDAYVAAADAGEASGTDGLARWKAQIEKAYPGSPLAAFAAYRWMGLEYSSRLSKAKEGKDIAEVQKWWRAALAAFINAYPTLDETPEALFRLGMAEEANGRGSEKDAIARYEALASSHPAHPLAAAATGSIRRLTSEGGPLQLSGTTLAGQSVDLSKAAGKVTVVYFWGSFQADLKADAKRLADLQKEFGAKVDVVTVCLDTNAEAAKKAAGEAQLPGQHLFAADGSLAAQYGIMTSHVFVVGKDGKVANKNAQLSILADEIGRQLK